MSMELIQDLLTQSERNINVANMLTKEGGFEHACFWSQQAVSLALFALWDHIKATDVEIGRRYERPPQFDELAKLVPTLQKYSNTYKVLDSYYISARYPPPVGDKVPYEYFDRRLAEETVGWAKQIRDEVKDFINA